MPGWIQRVLDRCESCSLDDEDDRRRLALAIADEMPQDPAYAQLLENLELCIATIRELVAMVGDGHMWHEQQVALRAAKYLLERVG